MRFDLLNQSIALNAGEAPSLYNALNMVRSLFQDVEDAADACLSQCPIGDEKLPLELVWLSSELLSIYEDNSEALQRNRAQLDSIMEELRDTQAELHTLSDALQQLPGKKAELQQLEKELADSRADYTVYTELLGSIEAARKELDGLKCFDTDAAEQELAALRGDISQYEDQIQCLTEDIRKQKWIKSDRSSEVSSLQSQLNDLNGELMQLGENKQSLLDEKLRILGDISTLTQETNSYNTELATMRSTLSLRQQERDEAAKQVEDYHRDTYDPVIQERDSLLHEQKQLQAEKDSADQQIITLTNQKRSLVLDIGKLKQTQEHLTTECESKSTQKEQLTTDCEKLTGRLEKITDDLEFQENEYNRLNDQELPAAQKLLDDENARCSKLQTQITDIRTEASRLRSEYNQKNGELPGLKHKLEELRRIYDALFISYSSNNRDILEMEQKIRELEQSNTQERLDLCRTQKQEELRRLKAISEECASLDAEIAELSGQVQTERARQQTLEDRKKAQEEGLVSIRALLEELRPCDTADYRRRAEDTVKRFKTLQAARDSLDRSVSDACKCFRGIGLSDACTQLRKLEEYLSSASTYADAVYEELIGCSKALKNHIMEEPK